MKRKKIIEALDDIKHFVKRGNKEHAVTLIEALAARVKVKNSSNYINELMMNKWREKNV